MGDREPGELSREPADDGLRNAEWRPPGLAALARRAPGGSLAVLLLVVLAAFHPLFVQGHSAMAALAALVPDGVAHLPVADPAAAQLGEAEVWSAARAVRLDGWPTWDLSRGLGVHIADQGLASYLHPLRLPLHAGSGSGSGSGENVPQSFRFDLCYLLRVLCAAAGAWLLARRIGMSPAGSVTAGAVFALSGPILRQLHAPWLDGIALLPAALVCADLCAASGGMALGVAAAVAFFLLAAGGGLTALVPGLLALAALGYFRRGHWTSAGARGLGGVVAAASALAASAWLPALLWGSVPLTGRELPGPLEALAGLLAPEPFSGDVPLLAHSVPAVAAALALCAGPAPRGLGGAALLAAMMLCAGSFGAPGRALLPVFALGLALAAGAGLDALRGETPGAAPRFDRPRAVRALRRATTAVALLCVLGALAGALGALGDGRGYAGTLGALGHLAALGSLWLCSALPRARWGILLGGLVCVEAVSMAPFAWNPRPADSVWADRPPFVAELLHQRSGGGRIVATASRPSPMDCAVHGLRDARVPLGRTSPRYDDFVRALAPMLAPIAAPDAGTDREGLPAPGTPAANALDLLNVRYAVEPGAGPSTPRVEAREPLPFAFFPKRVKSVAGPAAAIEGMRAEGWRGGEVAFLETAAPKVETGPDSATAGLDAKSPLQTVELRVQSTGAAWLVLSVEPHAALCAEVDGEAVSIVAADAALSAVLVPAGRHRVRLFHRADPTGAVTWLAVLGAIALCWSLWRVARDS